MTERERLIELINDVKDIYPTIPIINGMRQDSSEVIADHLLSNGVIVPPCKAGDKLYRIFNKPYSLDSYVSSFTETVEPYSIIVKGVLGGYSCIPFEEFGKTVFLTKEEAEKALKERSEGK